MILPQDQMEKNHVPFNIPLASLVGIVARSRENSHTLACPVSRSLPLTLTFASGSSVRYDKQSYYNIM